MNEENKNKINKLETFAKNAELANFEEVQEINDHLKTIAEKPVPTEVVHKIQLEGLTGPQGPAGESIVGPAGPKGADSKVPGPRGPKGEQGERGSDGTNGTDGQSGSPDTPEQIKDKLETLTDEDRLDVSAVKGFSETLQSIKDSGKSVVVKSGGSRGFQFYLNSTKKGLIQYLNLVAGSNIVLTASKVSGMDTVTVSLSPKITVSATAPTSPSVNDLWIDIS